MFTIFNEAIMIVKDVFNLELSKDEDTTPSKQRSVYHRPSVADALAVKEILLAKLPMEMVDTIIDSAEYWPHTSVALEQGQPENSSQNKTSISIVAGTNENCFLLRSYPLGYIPKVHDPSNISFESKEYPNITPRPGVTPDKTSSTLELTRKTLSQWTDESQTRGDFPCRRIVFTIKSHDQGWGGSFGHRGTYQGSFTWFEVGKEKIICVKDKILEGKIIDNGGDLINLQDLPQILLPKSVLEVPESSESVRPVCTTQTLSPTINSLTTESSYLEEAPRTEQSFFHPLLPDQNILQKNLTAIGSTKEHVVVWSYDDDINPKSEAAIELEENGRGCNTGNGSYVRSMRPGDIVTVWGKSRFSQWVNYVEGLNIDVYWAV
ncbi:BgTH12-02273 [Blumeria graminis f. sp. triticale]|uniref:Bgt-2630 n=3 Tax=Blumeria graminis TaxID=34373 RepID=A0A061HHM0_BLUGR|nr:hypothetical protein BGT96224_2630 [Blumeria graminis f. sp. tritici 96224]CAD6502030.1 BgTH12-02273 [Blumeria graminis f. sp. triticale]VDB85990.1 Bgt-2630 [Blumeria graminis f. sp. tritici]